MITIRYGKKADAPLIAEFQLKMALETEGYKLAHDTVISGVNAVFYDKSKGQYFLAEQSGKIVASLLTTYEWSDWRCGNVLWIQSVYVLPEYRKNGVFKKMYQHIQDIVESNNNFKGIRLYVDKTNKNAQKVYSKIGMNGEHYTLYEWMPDD